MSKDVIERLQNRIKKQLTNFENIRFTELEGKELLELLKRLADYEIIINAYHQDDADWHKLADINGSAICALVDGIIKLQSKLAEYENMEPVGHFYRSGDGFIGEVIDEYKNDDDVYPLYRHPKKELKFTAEIKLTDFVHGVDGKSIAFGYVFNDSRKRFEDGVEIKTSLVTNTETYKTDGYIKTQNSIYKIRE
ncbi:hypothetical protein [Xenorhabdus bovienii]|uniref:hypothetical protein n=1 Tax=Xenorhabdus bovienii TaxID=40576 RepID=UPI0023B341FB|nr:hypothetical protein [Xenorhabdus bovienii]MDE9483145.1 hypothetical protein [Xenorhabdus bovienii]